MTELEERLRAELPRLADLIAHRPDEEPPTLVSRRERSRGHRRAIATAVAICVLLGGVTTFVLRSHHAHAPASSPQVVVRDQWRSLPPSPLGPRANVVAVWTGDDVLVWGGYRGDAAAPLALQSGAVYNPTTNSWKRIADNQWAHPGAVGVWADDRLFILAKNGGALYDPAHNAWHDIALLPNDTGGGFLAAAWSGTTLFGVVAERESGMIAVARYDNRHDAWSIGKPLRVLVQSDRNDVSTVWTGTELVVSDGGRSVWAYDPTTDAWRALANLGPGATSSSIVSIAGELVAVYLTDDGLRATACCRGQLAHDRRCTRLADLTADRDRRRGQTRRDRSIRPRYTVARRSVHRSMGVTRRLPSLVRREWHGSLGEHRAVRVGRSTDRHARLVLEPDTRQARRGLVQAVRLTRHRPALVVVPGTLFT